MVSTAKDLGKGSGIRYHIPRQRKSDVLVVF